MNIILPARFDVCADCGKHGHIVFSDGQKGREAVYQDQALGQAREALKEGLIVFEELGVLERQILSSTLEPSGITSILSALEEAICQEMANFAEAKRKAKVN